MFNYKEYVTKNNIITFILILFFLVIIVRSVTLQNQVTQAKAELQKTQSELVVAKQLSKIELQKEALETLEKEWRDTEKSLEDYRRAIIEVTNKKEETEAQIHSLRAEILGVK